MAQIVETYEYREILRKINEGIEEFKEKVSEGTKKSLTRARVVSSQIGKDFKEFRKITLDSDFD